MGMAGGGQGSAVRPGHDSETRRPRLKGSKVSQAFEKLAFGGRRGRGRLLANRNEKGRREPMGAGEFFVNLYQHLKDSMCRLLQDYDKLPYRSRLELSDR